jgi:soluble lytic murein transglycosylase-like protein
MKRKTVAATIAIELALLGSGPACAASVQGAPPAHAAVSDAETLAAGLARLGAAMTRALPGNASSSPAVTTVAPLLAGRCEDGVMTPDVIRKMVEDEATRQGVDVKLAIAIASQESNFGERVNSPAAAAAGAMGVMQLTAETANHYSVVNPCDVAENVRGGISFIKDLSARFGGNVFLVLAAYNAGEKRVYAAKGVPPISETVRYVAAAANAYYDFPSVLSGSHRPHEPIVAPSTDPSAPQEDSVGQKWIGGSVLYIEQEK